MAYHRNIDSPLFVRQSSPLSYGYQSRPWNEKVAGPQRALSHPAIRLHQGRADRSSSEPLPSKGPEPTFSFQLALPRFYVPYRWWEDGASMILWAFDHQDIKRLLRFRLYENDELPRYVLQNRNADVVSGFLASLLPAEQGIFDLELSHHDKVEEILDLCQLRNPPVEPWRWHPNYSYNAEPRSIASYIDAESSRQFQAVPFEDWIRYALGYPTESIQWFFSQHKQLHDIVSAHLDLFTGEFDTYVEVERHLRGGSPFAQYVLLQCLSVRGLLNSEVPDQSNQWVVGFIIRPIQELFKAHLTGLPSMLKKLSVLALSFERKYRTSVEIDWSAPFEANPAYLNDFFSFREVEPLARKLTHIDTREFSPLSVQSFVEDTVTLRSLSGRWHLLCSSTEECCLALPEMAIFFKNCIRVLHRLRNYYSATAILYGLQKANMNVFDPFLELGHEPEQSHHEFSTHYFELMDSTGNYALYRETMRTQPGIPFLLPHIVEYQSNGEDAIATMFPLCIH
ncbi:hypothetical protein McanMca71_004886 [Microsporum canis]|uniref:Ras-GEF domain-containing protein n=1 Tax=Arthroderma otae (strain ATCC MYA-4605 / CBS 113480) TaxID=554155 RepID=C5FZD1_ARTOC|nr:conserved hypothetical protein [Microsporum canis CBS 113480]EEQ35234.1 conserved hypothetical protein [Microsporum canis CBS 113480]